MYLEYLMRVNDNMSGWRDTEKVSSEDEAIELLKKLESRVTTEIWGAKLYKDADKKILIKKLQLKDWQ